MCNNSVDLQRVSVYLQGCYASVHTLMVQYSYIPIGICSAVIAIEVRVCLS